MPEQLTRHPEVTLQVLGSASGVQCAAGAKQEILTSCPPARFCKLPGGEMCVYGLPEARSMTQIRLRHPRGGGDPGRPGFPPTRE